MKDATTAQRQKRYRLKQQQRGKVLFRRYVTAATAKALAAVITALEESPKND